VAYKYIGATTITAGGTTLITFSSIPSTFDHLVLMMRQKGDSTGQTVLQALIRFNSDTGANYWRRWLYTLGNSMNNSYSTSGMTSMNIGDGFAGLQTDSTNPSGYEVFIPNYCNEAGSKYKSIYWNGGFPGPTASSVGLTNVSCGTWFSNNAITSITIQQEGNVAFMAGTSMYLYGIS
jgi:hypothetical protein